MAEAQSDSGSAASGPRLSYSRPPGGSDPRRSSKGSRLAPGGAFPKQPSPDAHEGTILEDIEDPEEGEPSGRVSKSPSVPLNRLASSSRTRSMSGFGLWRSVRRKSRHVSTESDSDRSLEMAEMRRLPGEPMADRPSSGLQSPADSSRRESTETAQPLHESHEQNRARVVSFTTPKTHRKEEDSDVFLISEHHHLV